MASLTLDEFAKLIQTAPAKGPRTFALPISIRLLADQLTPVLAYRRLVSADERHEPSFLLESVEGGERQGRHSILGAQPVREVLARGHEVTTSDHATGTSKTTTEADPLLTLRGLSAHLQLLKPPDRRGGLPNCFLGGWVGFAAYDAVRYAEPEKLNRPPRDDRNLPDLQFGFYDGVIVFDHVDKLVRLSRPFLPLVVLLARSCLPD